MFSYNKHGKHIENIEQWAKDHGERMIKFTATRKMPNLATGKMEEQTFKGAMPESFWGSLKIDNGWVFREDKE
jgi:epoxyqueuosine reductase QueG